MSDNQQRPGPDPAEDPDVIELATRVFTCARTGDTAALCAYLDAGVPADLTNDKGDTLVMLAAYHGRPEAVQALCDRGADPGRLNDRGQSPLAGAVFKGEEQVVRILVRHGADPAAGTPSAVQAARMFDRQELLDLFDEGPQG
ncbi:ankyrin repeat domain-containing protein [Nocardiopsis chromatogenes]|uniref:ankyrin repeat domain-containing protein n=1 Tax=Nocardiopsis chromatogenes TaxID=280239 RepID=UPI000349EB1F|nr:ankyrin repeat domain-containing protein [Nocardiopsis chromatogenes]